MKNRIMAAAVLAGGLGLTAAPAWSGGQGSHESSASGESQMVFPGEYSSGSIVLSQSNMMEVERNLESLGLNPGPIDGVIDSETQSAISEFQIESRLPVTGTANHETMQELRTAANQTGDQHGEDRSGRLEDGSHDPTESSS